MRILRVKDTAEPIQRLMDDITVKMHDVEVGSDEYQKLMENLQKLHALKTLERRNGVSMDTIAIIVGNLAGLLIIVAYEQRGHIWPRTATSQILKPRTPTIHPQ